tara:strand:+ start:179 stop:520 length:342 start_codon:yes stop_codon:yes gene_type:complete
MRVIDQAPPILATAILELSPNARVSIGEEDVNKITWHDGNPNKITAAQIQTKHTELVVAWNALEYSRQREEEYGNLNQLELMSDDSINGTTTHKDAIAAIKTKWPKDNSGPVE